jgi:hypothetical protein
MAGPMFQGRLSIVQEGSGRFSGCFRMAVWFQSGFSLAFQSDFNLAFQSGFRLVFLDISVWRFMVVRAFRNIYPVMVALLR